MKDSSQVLEWLPPMVLLMEAIPNNCWDCLHNPEKQLRILSGASFANT